MSNPTSNFGWVMPTSTDLVTDLPADFAVFGQGVDTTMAGLKGGTTGQILSKTSATDMAFTWIANDQGDITGVTAGTGISGGGTSGAVTITNDMATTITTAGDLIKGTGSGTYSRLGIGSTGQVLTVSSGAPVWATPASGAKCGQVVSTTKTDTFTMTSSTFADVTGLSVTITPTANTSKILVFVNCSMQGAYGSSAISGRLLRDSTAISVGTAAGSRTQATVGNFIGQDGGAQNNGSMTYLDSPATTSAVTYKIQVLSNTNGNTVYVNRSSDDSDSYQYARTVSAITVMEILA